LGNVGKNISTNLSDFKEDPVGFAQREGMKRIQEILGGDRDAPTQSPQLLAGMPSLGGGGITPAPAPLSLSSLLATSDSQKRGSQTALGLNNEAFASAIGPAFGSLLQRLS
jgi:hypothetical protein